MAAAAYAGVASLMNNIDLIMSHPRLSTSLDKKQIETLQRKADDLLEFIKNNNHGRVASKEVEDLERRIARAAHAGEDVIESHIVDRIHAGNGEASLGRSLDLQQIIQEMNALMEKANELKEREILRKEEQPTHINDDVDALKAAPLHIVAAETSSPVGLEHDVIHLMDKLTDQPKRHIISIVGMGGAGKTTLARNVYENLLIKQHFDIRAWATVSQQYNVKEILLKLLPSHGKDNGKSLDNLGLELHKTLSGRRYLIVLDDLWCVEAWDEVRRFFPNNENGSRVILTTRLSSVASHCGSNSRFTMKPLDENMSWELFCMKAFQQRNCPCSKLEKAGKEIARLCKGLPLSIVVIGGLLLKSPRSVKFWENFAKNIKLSPTSKEKLESLDVLSLSYNHLPPHLKPCFLYLGVFKEDSEICVSRIIKLWVAEGFLRPNDNQILEETAEDYLKDLISRNLVQVDKYRRNGKIGSCRIHDLLRDLCLKVGDEQELFHTGKGGTERRLLRCYFTLIERVNPIVRSVVTQYAYDLPLKYNLMRVLEARNCRSPTELLYDNANLRYLAYRHPYELYDDRRFWKLPSSVSLIWNLQTLIIDNHSTCLLVVAPIGIWKMPQLRHVECKRFYFPDLPHSDRHDCMENMQTLTTIVNLRLSEEVCEIIPNIKKLHLVYNHDLHGYHGCLIEYLSNLDHLHKLESLNMSIRISMNELSKKLAFPTSLNKLSLSHCKLHWDDLSMIGSLPQLEVLELGFFAVREGKRWSPIAGQFLRLKFLKIDDCDLHCWDADNIHFPVLEKLVICNLDELNEIPLDIGEIPTLELIRVERCSESTTISAMRIKEEQVENQGYDALQIQVVIRFSNLMSFKRRVERENLILNHIQLDIS